MFLLLLKFHYFGEYVIKTSKKENVYLFFEQCLDDIEILIYI